MDRRAFLGTAGAVVVSLSGCTEGGLREADYDIGMSANAFLPERYEATVGETVVWGNNGSRRHTVTAYDEALPQGADYFATGGFDSNEEARTAWFDGGGGGAIAPGDTFSNTFDVPGEHGYYCIPHEDAAMVGVIVVAE